MTKASRGEFILSWSQGPVCHGEEGGEAGAGLADHPALTGSREGWVLVPTLPSPFYFTQDPSPQDGGAPLRRVFLLLPVLELQLRHAQRAVSWVILNPTESVLTSP